MKTMETMPFTHENRLFSRLADVASYANLSAEDRLAYDADLKAYRDMMGQLSFAEARGMEKGMEKGMQKGMQKGMEKGLQKGMEKGRIEAMAEMVAEMYKEKMPLTQIARFAKTDVDTVRRLLGI